MDWAKINHFKEEEFKCKCGCGLCEMDQDFMEHLDWVREQCGIPLAILSGYRCPAHDKGVGGKGNHTTGKAADILCNSSTKRYALLYHSIGSFHRFGIGKSFIHLDDCKDKPQGVAWLY